MHPQALDKLHEQNIETLDALYEDMLRLATQGTPGAKDRLREIAELRARLSGDRKRFERQQSEIEQLAPS